MYVRTIRRNIDAGPVKELTALAAEFDASKGVPLSLTGSDAGLYCSVTGVDSDF
jgi:hypothetical protein